MLNIKKLIVSFFNRKANKINSIDVPINQYNIPYPSLNKEEQNSYEEYSYYKKDFYMTKTEISFYKKLLPLKNEGYNIETQINLSTIVKKCYKDSGNETKYRNELFRNIDFGIFSWDYQPLVLIELNDSSHNSKERKARDQRVNEICKKANIILLTFITSKPNENNYVLNRINCAIKEALGLKDEPFIKVVSIDPFFNQTFLKEVDMQKRLLKIKS